MELPEAPRREKEDSEFEFVELMQEDEVCG